MSAHCAFGRLSPGHDTGRRKMIGAILRGVDQGNSCRCKFVDERAKNRLRAFIASDGAEKKPGRPQVGNIPEISPAVIDLRLVNPSHHDRFMAVKAMQVFDPFPAPKHADPAQFIAFALQFGPGMAGKGRADHPPPRRLRAARDKDRKDAFTGNKSQRIHRKGFYRRQGVAEILRRLPVPWHFGTDPIIRMIRHAGSCILSP